MILDNCSQFELVVMLHSSMPIVQHSHLETHTADVAAFDRCQRAPTWTKTGTNYTQLVQCSCHTDSVALPCWSCEQV